MKSGTFTAQKTIFSFSKCSEKMFFPKVKHWNMIFLVLLGKMIFLFPDNLILLFRWKMKDDLSQRNTGKYDLFCKCSGKMVFPKKTSLEYDLSRIIRKDYISFSRKYDLIFRRKIKDNLSKKYMEVRYFL